MPTYEYRCKDCGENLEVVQAFTDEALTECPYCQGALRKVFNSVGISFKGSGFYKNDSRSSATTSSAGTGPSSSEGASPSSDGAASSDGSSSSSSSPSPSSGDSGSSSSSTKTEAASA